MNTKLRITMNGRAYKNINPWDEESHPDAWEALSGTSEDKDHGYYSVVSFVYRVVNLTANAVASIPWALVDANGEDYDVTSDWENKTGIIAKPSDFMRHVGLSLCMFGSAYFLKESNRLKKIRDLTYLVPTTIKPQISGTDGLTGFKRTVNNGIMEFTPDQLVYIWEPDPRVELGEPLACRYKAMMNAAGLLLWEDKFATDFMARGGIRPTMLMVQGMNNPTDRQNLESYWDKFIRGWFKLAGKIFNAEKVTPQTVGDGLDALSDIPLTLEKREDICVAAGIPLSVVMSNAANFATSQNDRRQFYENVILPDVDLICQTMNDQLWGKLTPPLYMEPRPETLDAFQEDETSRASAFKTYVDGGMIPEIAAQVVGIELPPGVEEYEDMFEEEEPPAPIPPQLQPFAGQDNPPQEQPDELAQPEPEPPAPKSLSMAALRELDIWKTKAIRAVKEGKVPNFVFTYAAIPQGIAQGVITGLASAATPEQVKETFAGVDRPVAETMTPTPVFRNETESYIVALMKSIELGVEALKHEKESETGKAHD